MCFVLKRKLYQQVNLLIYSRDSFQESKLLADTLSKVRNTSHRHFSKHSSTTGKR